MRVIDLAADFRIRDRALWEQWYKMTHACPELLEEAVYGLPELNRERIRSRAGGGQSRLLPDGHGAGIPAPGRGGRDRCRAGLVADCKSGVSGAGRSASVAHADGRMR